MALDARAREYPFRHRAAYDLPPGTKAREGVRLFSSYHCSRYNTQTKRLSAAMFEAVFGDIKKFLISP